MIDSVLILGGGSAGFLAALALRTRLPRIKVTVVRSKEIGVIGVGESTVPSVVNFLHGYLKLDPTAFLQNRRTGLETRHPFSLGSSAIL